MFEVAIVLVITLYTPEDRHGQTVWREEYKIAENTQEALDAAGDKCEFDARLWRRKALHASRGTWMLDVACDIQHDEAEPANEKR